MGNQSSFPAPPQSSQPGTETPSTSSNKKFAIIISILGIIILITIAILIFALFKKSPSPKISLIPTQKLTPTPTLNPYATWKTYTNTVFSLQYPPTWSFIEEKDAKTQTVNGVTFSGIEGTIHGEWGTALQGVSCLSQVNSQLYDILSQELNGCTYLDTKGNPAWFIGRKISGSETFQIEAQGISQNPSDKQVMQNILSTIKIFSSPQPTTTSTADWKTYTDALFSIQYPSAWTLKKGFTSASDIMIYDPSSLQTTSGSTSFPRNYEDIQSVDETNKTASQTVLSYSQQWRQQNNTLIQSEALPSNPEFILYDNVGDNAKGRNVAVSDGKVLATINTSVAHLNENSTANQALQTFKLLK